MSRSLYWKITAPFICLILISMGILGFFTINSVRNIQLENLRSNLVNEARLIAEDTIPGFAPTSAPDRLDSLAKVTGNEIKSRVTIIAGDGTVLGDSWENPAAMENHSTRPEVMSALASGTGESVRYSTTVGEDMMYGAVPIVNQGVSLGVARVALPLTAVNASVNSTIVTFAWTMGIAALLVIIAAALIARMITRPVRQMTRAAEKIASGQFDQQIAIRSNDELGILGRAFNKMSVNLKGMMKAISEEKSKLANVLYNITDGVIMTDSEGRILLVNPASERLFNFRETEVTGKPLIEAVHDHEIDALLVKCLKTAQEQSSQVDSIKGRFLRVVAVPLKAGKISGALLLFQDLTEMRSLQTMRREFVGNISHELRTPLAAIKAIVETLQDGALEEKETARDFLDKVMIEADSMTQMVNELIELSRIETGKVKLKLEPVDLNSLIDEIIVHMTPQAERKQITLSRELSAGLVPAPVDRERIRQVITNIVHNAIKFTPPNGKVTVSTRSEKDFAVVQVTDTGIGISKEDLPHIFERFFKADKARSGGGSGLGLAISKHIVQVHGGEIWVRSEEGKGSTFGFRIPLQPGNQ